MAREVEVLFIKDKKGFFNIGERKKVKPGYFWNYLLPQEFALLYSKHNQTKIAAVEKKAEKKLLELKKKADEVSTTLANKTINFHVKSHDMGKLYGAISLSDIAKEINKQFKTELDKYDIKGISSIKEVGEYKVNIGIHASVQIIVNVIVTSDEMEEVKKAESKRKKAVEKEKSNTEDKVEVADEETKAVKVEEDAQKEEPAEVFATDNKEAEEPSES